MTTTIDDIRFTGMSVYPENWLDTLRQYGLDKIKSLSEQIKSEQVGEKTKNLFAGALSVFKRKLEAIPGIVRANDVLENVGTKTLFKDITVKSELNLHQQLDRLLYIAKSEGDLDGVNFRFDGIENGWQEVSGFARESTRLIEEFKRRIKNQLMDYFRCDKHQAGKLIEDRLNNKYDNVKPAHFALIKETGEDGKMHLRLLSNDFVAGMRSFLNFQYNNNETIKKGKMLNENTEGDDDKKESRETEGVLVNNIVTYGDLDLYKKIDYLLYNLETSDNLNKIDVGKLTSQIKDASFDNNELLEDGQNVSINIQRKTANLIEKFKKNTINLLIKRFGQSENDAKMFFDSRINNQYEPVHFKLIRKKGEDGKMHLELMSDNFIDANLKTIAKYRNSLTEQLSMAIESKGQNKVDQADWYEVGSLNAKQVLDMLKKMSSGRNQNQFSPKVKQWINDSIDIFHPTPDETFAEYIERRFMKFGLPGIYNDVVNVVRVFNILRNKNDAKQKILDRQSIGKIPIEKVITILKMNKKARERYGIQFIINNDEVKPIKGESLKRYFYRLMANDRKCLKNDNTIDEDKLKNDPDFKNMTDILIEIIPKINKMRLLEG